MDQSTLDNWFRYHAPNEQQQAAYVAIRQSAKKLAETINAHCPDSADKSDAFRSLRNCVMTANASIALNGGTQQETTTRDTVHA